MNMSRLQKRLASSVHHHGKKKAWLDANETNEIANTNFRQQIQKLAKDGLIIQKPVKGNALKNNQSLMEHTHKLKADRSTRSSWLTRLRPTSLILRKQDSAKRWHLQTKNEEIIKTLSKEEEVRK
ncbi:60S ribosomal protein L19 [Microtus ochrogaster]|uniref:Large ribosomal subunit protein eL19 n=1 Tax=Microtus ochrogaster TaxID=79684 RepID=A0A8J6G1Q1_MICOH|nr:60S ribosomal protein L19 [Microtus ochrogaster]